MPPDPKTQNNRNIIIASVILVLVLVGLSYASFRYAKTRSGTVVLPGGITYLGPSTAQMKTSEPSPISPLGAEGKIPVPPEVNWMVYKGKLFPYAFSYPASLNLGVFPNDPYDAVTVFYPGTNSQTNLFFRVEDLNKLNKQQYINTAKMEYVKAWWQGYNWKGYKTIMPFTNASGLVGYRASYINDKGETPYDQVFFEVPGRPDLVIWISGSLFEKTVFDKLVDSVSWK